MRKIKLNSQRRSAIGSPAWSHRYPNRIKIEKSIYRASSHQHLNSSNAQRLAAARLIIAHPQHSKTILASFEPSDRSSVACPKPCGLFANECSRSRLLRNGLVRDTFMSAASRNAAMPAGNIYLLSASRRDASFLQPTEDAVLLDEERKRISGDLRLSQDKIDESVYGFLSRLASSPATSVTFSYSCRDTREYRETYASWIVLQAYRLQQRNPNLSYTQMKEALGEPKSAVPADRDADHLSAEEWWLGSVVNTGAKGIHLVEGNFPDVAQGRTAELKRQSPEFTAFDGYVPEAGPVLDPCSPKNVFSVTELEGAAQCPFRFFLKRGLGVQPVDEIERDKDVWLDPLTRGSEITRSLRSLVTAYPRWQSPTQRRGHGLADCQDAATASGTERGDACGYAGDLRARVEGLCCRCRAVHRSRIQFLLLHAYRLRSCHSGVRSAAPTNLWLARNP